MKQYSSVELVVLGGRFLPAKELSIEISHDMRQATSSSGTKQPFIKGGKVYGSFETVREPPDSGYELSMYIYNGHEYYITNKAMVEYVAKTAGKRTYTVDFVSDDLWRGTGVRFL